MRSMSNTTCFDFCIRGSGELKTDSSDGTVGRDQGARLDEPDGVVGVDVMLADPGGEDVPLNLNMAISGTEKWRT